MSRLVRVLSSSELAKGKMRAVEVEGRSILLVNFDGSLFGVSNICTHQEAFLSEGTLVGKSVVCPLHGSEFDLETGKAVFPPATEPLQTYLVQIKDDSIFVEV
jgi:nitrite reductase/ring-hydroxylating ferredoxin subunit